MVQGKGERASWTVPYRDRSATNARFDQWFT
jgi:hypothetical protein